jgi:hypothetical protein
MPAAPEQPPTDSDAERTFLDALPCTHREALVAGLKWLVDAALDAVAAGRTGVCTSGLVARLPGRWAHRYDAGFCRRFAVVAIALGSKLRATPACRGYLTSCVAEELALHLAVEHARSVLAARTGADAGDDPHLEALLESACADRQYRMLYWTGGDRVAERDLGTLGIWQGDLRYCALFRPFATGDAPPLHPFLDPDRPWCRATPEPPPDEEDGP